ncbi:type II toxin-antitoxin system HicB family antitoxin [Mycetocola tolaasinivorans]|uniref:Type II toxin-antitoxin system HicB family antitoxin n=1 Tax=Mycetocola tolaasinivorans TaxID=76635 RepID=A0A3L7ABM6_9MICO|nr:type II toxin-antitoxin system HicB family antitoxin [Mycetocola tolaasinivorans]RLP77405.1 type II toxin-antitoxin system HicB family antitoxin [Mycetocola tolaasinivorans]
MIHADHYTYRVRWSREDDGFLGTVAEFPSLSWFAETSRDAFSGINHLVAEILTDMELTGEIIPSPLSDRAYSGKLLVRIAPELHRNLAIEAAEQQVSLNRLISTRLAS